MKYCLPFYVGMKYLKTVDEITIKYKNSHDALIDFLKEHSHQRIIIDMKDIVLEEKLIKFFGDLTKVTEVNFALKLSYKKNKENIEKIKGSEVNFFFSEYCIDWSGLTAFLNLGVSDVYIVNDLGFEIIKVAEVAHRQGVNIRVFPNVAQASVNDKNTEITRFFIRPEDIETYEPCVDVCEIFGSEKNAEVYYEIYHKDKKWGMFLKIVIANFEEDILNPFIKDTFALRRLNCGKKCLKGGNCKSCFNALHIAKTLDKVRKANIKKLN